MRRGIEVIDIILRNSKAIAVFLLITYMLRYLGWPFRAGDVRQRRMVARGSSQH